MFCLFFFFQAEDGIRDGHVTGVQTCALPIYRRRVVAGFARRRRLARCLGGGAWARGGGDRGGVPAGVEPALAAPLQARRSEEHTSELQSRGQLVCRLLLEKKTQRRGLRPPPG